MVEKLVKRPKAVRVETLTDKLVLKMAWLSVRLNVKIKDLIRYYS